MGTGSPLGNPYARHWRQSRPMRSVLLLPLAQALPSESELPPTT
jgi:hypothetical protein